VADDEQECRQFLSLALASQYDVLTARSGEEAIQKAIAECPSCILLDVMMPQMDGFMVCEILKSLEPTKSIPIIFVSAKPRGSLWPLAQKIGVSDYVEKPFTIRQISEAVKRIVEPAPLERRKAPRLKLTIAILVSGKDSLGNEFNVHTQTVDVSRYGALVELPFRVPVGDQVKIQRSSAPSPNGFSILTQARIAWNDEVESSGPYLHGLEFLNPSSEWVVLP
jgi:CheY-like chemotaxis protein